jgi:DNA-binding winged helix-turn-helix (wHTH) protein/tetratricopeptide (TPR) repeat protein
MTTSIVRPIESSLSLAEIEPFALGGATVDPGHRRISWNGKCCEEMEPRVMKVLVALAQAESHVVSRDRLIHLCWDGRIVGDDAINRCVQSIRRVADRIEPRAFRIETTARVGYTLIVEWLPSAQEAPARLFLRRSGTEDNSGGHIAGPPMRLLSIGAATLALATAAAVLPSRTDGGMTRIAIVADQPSDATLARELKVDLNQYAGSTLTDVSLVDSPAKSNFLVRISTSREGRLVHGNATLSDRGNRDLLWSSTTDSPMGDGTILRGQLSAKIGNLVACLSKMTPKSGRRLDTGGRRLFLAACTQMDDMVDQHDVDMLRKLTSAAPQFAAGWSYLALAEAQLGNESIQLEGPSLRDGATRRSANADFERAQSLDPALGTNFVAAAALVPASDWSGRLNTLEAGIARDPDEQLTYQALSAQLAAVGLVHESVDAARRAAALKPLSVNARATLIWSLVHGGEIALARAELATARKLWPDADELDSVRFSLELRYGDAAAAQRMLDAGQATLGGCVGGDLLMRARLSPTKRNVADLIRFVAVDTRARSATAPAQMLSLAQFGATDEIYAILDRPGAISALQRDSEILFRPQFSSMRRDPRFTQLTAQLGLLQFWSESGRWPDFCSDSGLAYDCKAEAARLLRPRSIARRAPPVPQGAGAT